MGDVGLIGGPGGTRHGIDGTALLAHEEEVGSVRGHVEVGRGRHAVDEDLQARFFKRDVRREMVDEIAIGLKSHWLGHAWDGRTTNI